jgi:hypothetical protein
MDFKRVINSARGKKYIEISKDELNQLLANSSLIIEENTYISDKIRLLEYGTDLLIQEKTTNDEYIIRIMKTKEEAEELIKERLDIYDKMWDGCGCKVDYYD